MSKAPAGEADLWLKYHWSKNEIERMELWILTLTAINLNQKES